MKILLLDNNKLQYKQHIWYNLLYIYKCVKFRFLFLFSSCFLTTTTFVV